MSVPLWRSAGLEARLVNEVAATYQLPTRIARLLCSRFPTEEIPRWLDIQSTPYLSPTVFCDLDAAASRVWEAVGTGQRVAIIGDYDVDGVTATTILAVTLDAIGADVACYIPHRVDDGYGLSKELVDRAIAGGCALIVTVDNGIRAVEAVTYAREQGMDVIVTDHHEPGEVLPTDALAVIHYLRSEDETTSVLSGAGVAWKLATALLARQTRSATSSPLAEQAQQELQDWLLGLAALGALADIMPMKGDNRRIVAEGLNALRNSRQPGWLALCQVAGVDLRALTETSILWSITPRLNAAGRMDSAEIALQLLCTKDATEAEALAQQLEQVNTLRRRETTRSTTEAAASLEDTYSDVEVPAVIVVAGAWPLGVVGIVAAKLVETYRRPAIVFADDGSELLRGSGRAPDGLPFYEAVSRCSDWLEHFGGHSAALGCGITRDKLQPFAEAVAQTLNELVVHEERAGNQEANEPFVADDYLPLGEATLDLAQWLERLGPYGPGYPQYRFYVGPLEVTEAVPMGAGKHIRLTVREGRQQARLIWFNPPAWAFELKESSLLSAVVALEVNTWRDRQQPQLRVETAWSLAKPVLRPDFAEVYRLLQARRKLQLSDFDTVPQQPLTAFQTIFDTFVDLGFAYFKESAYHVVEQAEARDLRESVVYQAHLRSTAVDGEAVGE